MLARNGGITDTPGGRVGPRIICFSSSDQTRRSRRFVTNHPDSVHYPIVDTILHAERPAERSGRALAVQKQIDGLMDRIVEAESATVVNACEARIDKLEREKIVLVERTATIVPPEGRLKESIEHALAFLANPWNTWKNGSLSMRRAVPRLAFAEPLRYSGASGYRTPERAFPFKELAGTSKSV